MIAATRWIIVAIASIYIVFRMLPAILMTSVRIGGNVPATMSPELADYLLHLPWIVIVVAWLALFLYAAAVALLAMGRVGATRTLSIAVVVDIGGWLWARTATTYTEVFTPAEQTLDALLFLIMITIIVLMIVARRTGTLT